MAQILVDPHTRCGEVALVASSCLAARLTFGDLAGFGAPRGSVLVQSAGNARAIATASTASVFANRRLLRAFAEHCGGTSRASNPAATHGIATCDHGTGDHHQAANDASNTPLRPSSSSARAK